MPFGRYIGKPMRLVPAVYLLWLREKGCDNKQVNDYITNNLAALNMEAKSAMKFKKA